MGQVSTKRLSRVTGRHPKTLARWARASVIPGVFVGGPVGWLFDSDEVATALKKNKGNKAMKSLMRAKIL